MQLRARVAPSASSSKCQISFAYVRHRPSSNPCSPSQRAPSVGPTSIAVPCTCADDSGGSTHRRASSIDPYRSTASSTIACCSAADRQPGGQGEGHAGELGSRLRGGEPPLELRAQPLRGRRGRHPAPPHCRARARGRRRRRRARRPRSRPPSAHGDGALVPGVGRHRGSRSSLCGGRTPRARGPQDGSSGRGRGPPGGRRTSVTWYPIGKPLSPCAQTSVVARGGGTCRTSPHRVHRHVESTAATRTYVWSIGSSHHHQAPGGSWSGVRSRSTATRLISANTATSASTMPRNARRARTRRWGAAGPEPRRARRPAPPSGRPTRRRRIARLHRRSSSAGPPVGSRKARCPWHRAFLVCARRDSNPQPSDP